MSIVVYDTGSRVEALALPARGQQVEASPAVYETVTVSAVMGERTVPAVVKMQDGQPVEIEPARVEAYEIEPARDWSHVVEPAVYRDETPAEMLARMIADGMVPNLPWTKHVIVAAHPAGRYGEHWTIDWQTGVVSIIAAPQPPPPDEISDRQFFQGLAMQGLITEAEALAAVATGTIPAAMAAFIDALPASDRFAARMVLCGATIFNRLHPLTQAFATMQGMDATALANFWRFCAGL